MRVKYNYIVQAIIWNQIAYVFPCVYMLKPQKCSKDQTKQIRMIMYESNQCAPSVGHHSLDPEQPALVSVGPLSVVVQVDMYVKSNLTCTVLTKKSIKM